jgi:hypothetical protein
MTASAYKNAYPQKVTKGIVLSTLRGQLHLWLTHHDWHTNWYFGCILPS